VRTFLLVFLVALLPACYGAVDGGVDDDDSFPSDDDDDDDDATTDDDDATDDDDDATDDDDDDVTPPPTDTDGDGIPDDTDCAPEDATIFPGAEETCDGIDSNCDGEPEDIPTGAPQEMFIYERGRLYVTILSVDASCDIYLALDQPVTIPDMVGEVHSTIGTEVDVGAVTSCSVMHFTSTSCSTEFSTLDPAAFHVNETSTNHWLLEHEDGADSDYNDVVFEAVVELREDG
jgi:hypothetical protein